MATYWPKVQIVSEPSTSATVRCDLNMDTTWPDGDAFSLGAPSLIGDPGGIGAEYDYRTLAFNLVVKAGEAAALAKQTQLARELMRDENWLLFQLSAAAAPVWFRVLRSSPGEVSLAKVYYNRTENQWEVGVSLVADPFAVGEQETITTSVRNDPAISPHGLARVLTTIKGDAPAPCVVDIDAGTSDYQAPLVAITPLTVAWPGVQAWQAESGSLGTNASRVDDSAASNGQRVNVSFNTPTDAVRLTLNPTPAFAGRYRLFARVTASNVTTSATVTVRGAGTSQVTAAPATTLKASGAEMVELGTYAFPKGNIPTTSPYTLAEGEVTISAYRATTSGTLGIDYVVAIPVEVKESYTAQTLMEFPANTRAIGGRRWLVDGECETTAIVTTSGTFSQVSAPVPTGDFLRVVPGATNVLHLLTRRSNAPSSAPVGADSIGETRAVTVSYRPRWLNLAAS